MLETVHVTRDRQGGACGVGRCGFTGPCSETSIAATSTGHPVTSLSRTVVDLARCLPYDQGVAVADRGLAAGCDPVDARRAPRPGQVLAGRAPGAASRSPSLTDGARASASRSAGSGSRDAELPLPLLQYEVVDDNGLLIGRCDFVWPARRTLGEFDGLDQVRTLSETGRDAPARPFTARSSVRMRCAITVGRWPAGRGTTSGSRRHDRRSDRASFRPIQRLTSWRVVHRPRDLLGIEGSARSIDRAEPTKPEQIDRHTP